MVFRCSVVVMAIWCGACGIFAVFDGREAGAEQFTFPGRPGSGMGPEADALAQEMSGPEGDIADADHIATFPTPLGQLDIVTYREMGGGMEFRCRATVGRNGGGASCASPAGGEERPALAADALSVVSSGVGGEWTTVDIEAGAVVDSLTGLADDGTRYWAGIVRGHSVIVYPVSRGGLQLQGLDRAGEPIGIPVRYEAVGEGPASTIPVEP